MDRENGYACWTRWRRPPSSDRWSRFAEHLGDLLEQGVPLVTALELLRQDRRFSQLPLAAVLRHLNGGDSLSAALKQSGFPVLLVALTKGAESYGSYARSLQEAGRYYRRQWELRRNLAQVSFYPLLVLAMATGSLFFFLSLVLPGFAELYEGLQLQLPRSTQWLLAVGDAMKRSGEWLMLSGMAFFAALFTYLKTPAGRRRIERSGLRLPVWGEWMRLRYTQFFSSQVGLLLQAGVPLEEACQVVGTASPWRLLHDEVDELLQQIRQGTSFSGALSGRPLWDDSLAPVIRVGEEAGRVASALSAMGRTCDRRLQSWSQLLIRVLEPLLILFVGAVLGAMMLALFLPMFGMMQ